MTLDAYLEIAWNNIRQRKLRTALTTLGIIIAVTTIFALISIGNGLNNGIKESFEKIGTNRLYVMPKGSGVTSLQGTLTDDDVKALEGMSDFIWVTPYIQEQTIIEYNNQKKKVTVWATKTDNLEERWKDTYFQVGVGRLFTTDEKYSTIIGYRTATEMFDKEIHLNENIVVNGKKFQVVGIFDEIGTPQDDNVIELPIETAQNLFDKEGEVSMIELITKQGVDMDALAVKITHDLKRERGDDLFDIVTPDQLLSQFSTVLSIVNTVLGAIASISLVVGGVGIMNSCYTSVMERKKEIGIMKALGAQNRSILLLFLAEAGFLGLLGGVGGVIIGFLIAKVTQYAATSAGFLFLKITFNPFLMIGCILFAVCFGVLAGYLPAKDAMQKQIVQALRKA